jgi:hypothetical protein
VGDAPPQERAAEHVDVRRAAQQDGDVAAADRAGHVSLEYALGRRRGEQARDPVGHDLRLGFDAGTGYIE